MNCYGVRDSVWKKWSRNARLVFNITYAFIIDNQDLMVHPNTKKVLRYQWKTTAWNAAWIAANATDGYETKVLKGGDLDACKRNIKTSSCKETGAAEKGMARL